METSFDFGSKIQSAQPPLQFFTLIEPPASYATSVAAFPFTYMYTYTSNTQ